jgi:hypothetical protein
MQRTCEIALGELEFGAVARGLVFTDPGLMRHLGRLALRVLCREAKPVAS